MILIWGQKNNRKAATAQRILQGSALVEKKGLGFEGRQENPLETEV